MSDYLTSPKTEKFLEDDENERLRYGLASMQGWRATMEDVHTACLDLDTSTSFFGVYDGHEGVAVSMFCGKFLHRQVLLQESYIAGDLETSLRKSFLRMDELMCGKRGLKEISMWAEEKKPTRRGRFSISYSFLGSSKSVNEESSAAQVYDWPREENDNAINGPDGGTTACVAIIRNNQLVVANAGDSRCVISRNGQAYNLTTDHRPDLEVERTRIVKAGGFVRRGRLNGRLNMSRTIGDFLYKLNEKLPPEEQVVTAYPDLTSVEICDDVEFLVLATDGVWECMSNQQVVEFIREQLKTENKLSVICGRVLDKCLGTPADYIGSDNMTIILVQFKEEELPLSTFPHPLDEGCSSETK